MKMTPLEWILSALLVLAVGYGIGATVGKIEINNSQTQSMTSVTVNQNQNGNVNMNNVSMLLTNAALKAVTNDEGGVYLYPDLSSVITQAVTNIWTATNSSNWSEVKYLFDLSNF